MEGKVCIYNKFGFCKFKDTCRNQHIMQICETHLVRISKAAKKDTQKYAKDLQQKRNVSFE